VSRLWVFDEIHKYRRWRNYLKGVYDGRTAGQQILVTGSGRLDLYRFGGDSLQGRYHFLRLHPFWWRARPRQSSADLEQLLVLGGFPEPFLSGSEQEARRWTREYRTLLVREEVTSLERVQDLGHLELLVMRLPALVGAPLSINALREDLQVSHKAASSWLHVLERLFVVFRLAPFGAPRIRAVKKERNYQFDWSTVPEPGRALRISSLRTSSSGCSSSRTPMVATSTRYFRDTDGREVDFVITERRTPIRLIECKTGARDVDPSLRYLRRASPRRRPGSCRSTRRRIT
jgi:predicted AAA+ superfamily ATPase